MEIDQFSLKKQAHLMIVELLYHQRKYLLYFIGGPGDTTDQKSISMKVYLSHTGFLD